MNNEQIDSQIRAHKIKQGVVHKLSKFFKEWRDRWIVLTRNYLFTFKSKVYVDPSAIIEIKSIKSIKSYLKSKDDRQIGSFKISTGESSLYFKCKNVSDKWSWIVAFQRLSDYRNHGASAYNDYDAVLHKGFEPLEISKVANSPTLSKIPKQPVKISEKIKQVQKDQPSKVPPSVPLNQSKQKLWQVKQNINITIACALPPSTILNKVQQAKSTAKEASSSIETYAKRVDELKQIYEKKLVTPPLSRTPSKKQNISSSPKQNTDHNINRRAAVVSGLFSEFQHHKQAEVRNFLLQELKIFVEFLVNIVSNHHASRYAPYVIFQTKTNKNRKQFAGAFAQNYNNGRISHEIDLTEQKARSMLTFLQLIYNESPELFQPSQIKQMKQNIIKYIGSFKKEETLIMAMKTFVILHGADNSDKDSVKSLISNLAQIDKSGSREARTLSHKIRELANM